ncbi:flagellar basal body-associated FliL family protein [Yoonia maritima]|uniref:flagellar basal body-associated FliL family protein n=1 Tax=Yoonia maritima TaxID=1435347 RepID=UPI000D0F554A|nr:flagellar basal body-associated FliL family protein [Yoonia maritima]
MSDETDAPKKGTKAPLVIGLVLALIGGGGGFFAVQKGATDHAKSAAPVSEEIHDTDQVAVAFVALDPLIISLPGAQGREHLRFTAQLEVTPGHAADVEAIKPRIIDVLNGYLRAVEIAHLEDPSALVRLRAQMLRRVQVVAGEGRIRDLLIMEFVLS